MGYKCLTKSNNDTHLVPCLPGHGPHLESSQALLSSNLLTDPQPLLPHRLAS